MFCCALLCVHSSFAIISTGKREFVAFVYLSSLCLVIAVWLFLTMTRVCLQFVIVFFPDHTHYVLVTKAMIRLCGFAGWSTPLLFSCNKIRFPQDNVQIVSEVDKIKSLL